MLSVACKQLPIEVKLQLFMVSYQIICNGIYQFLALYKKYKKIQMIPEPRKYEKIMKIGQGAYGAVYKARDQNSNQFVALKVTKYDDNDEGIPSTTLRQISILKSINHRSIVKLLDIIHSVQKDKFIIQLVFEYMDEDLGKFIRRRKDGLDPNECRLIFRKIVEGVNYLHERNIYHRDLKPQNILINSHYDVKIADFGLSRVIINTDRTYSKEIQTLWYRSPQLLLGVKHYGSGVDIWSLGCILYELAEGKVLFKGDSQISQIFVIFELLGTPKLHIWPEAANLPHFKRTFPKMLGKSLELQRLGEDGGDLLMQLIQMNPSKRITIQQVLEHPYLNSM